MNNLTPKHATGIQPSLSLPHVVSTALVSGLTWFVALLFTCISLLVQCTYITLRTVIGFILKWSVYLLLGTIFLCCAFLLGVLSVITLGAVSLP